MARAVIVPSFLTPVWTRTVAGTEPAAAANSSERLLTRRTGLPVLSVSAAA